MSKNDLDTYLKVLDNEYAALASEGVAAGDVSGYVDTGSYTLNALLSGSIYGGLPANKVTALAGEPSTGKTFFAISIMKEFLNADPKNVVVLYESESAISKQMLVERGVDVDRVMVTPVETIQQFRTSAIRFLNFIIENKPDKKFLFVLDSLGNLSTQKEMEDIAAGKDTRDMTRAQLIRGAFRALTLKFGKANCPLIVTNHVYDVVGSYVPVKKMGGGSGLEYAASTIVFLSKKKEKDKTTNEVVGAIITAVLKKSRLSIENKKVDTLLDYQAGLDPYYGLLPLAEKFGIVKKVSTRYEFPDGTKAFEKAINKEPEKYFTKEILDQIDEHCKNEFLYGKTNHIVEEDEAA